jgi:hypothetical protein
MESNQTQSDISFTDVVAALLNSDTPLNPDYIYRLSDLDGNELVHLKRSWPKIPLWRRQALLEDMEQMFEGDYLLSFETICRFALGDVNPKIRFLALRSLQEYEVEDLIPTFLRIMEEDSDEELRALAASSLGKYIYFGEIEELPQKIALDIETRLLNVAGGKDTTLVRRRAVESLGFSSHKDVPILIQKAYDTNEVDWMTSALFAMGHSYDNRWDQIVIKMLDHTSPKIRFEAARAAGELEINQAKPQLKELLEDADYDVRMASVWSLSQIGGTELQLIFDNLLDEAELDREIQVIEDAIENLIFNQSIGIHDPLEFNDDLDLDELDNVYDEDLN